MIIEDFNLQDIETLVKSRICRDIRIFSLEYSEQLSETDDDDNIIANIQFVFVKYQDKENNDCQILMEWDVDNDESFSSEYFDESIEEQKKIKEHLLGSDCNSIIL